MSTATRSTGDLWGIGQFPLGDRSVTYPMSHDDLGRDLHGATEALRSLGITTGSKVLVVSLLSEATHYWPVQVALLVTGAQLSCADATRHDAFRVAMFLRTREYDAVVGRNREVIEGVAADGGSLGDVFGRVPLLAARPGAYERLDDAGLPVHRWLHVGPALGVECAARAGAHVDGEEWALDVVDGEVHITARKPRAATIDRQPTGLAGSVVTESCPCGRRDPRVVLDP